MELPEVHMQAKGTRGLICAAQPGSSEETERQGAGATRERPSPPWVTARGTTARTACEPVSPEPPLLLVRGELLSPRVSRLAGCPVHKPASGDPAVPAPRYASHGQEPPRVLLP